MAVRITNGGYSIISIEGFTAASSTTQILALSWDNVPAVSSTFTITISSLDSTAVKGTFSGDFFYNADPAAAKKTITNGAFYVPWKK